MIAPARKSSVLNEFGKPFAATTKPRPALADALNRDKHEKRKVKATYDAARDNDWLAYSWAQADKLDANSANSRAVRETLVKRSRLEGRNNGYYVGAIRTYSNDLLGTGPRLRMQTGSTNFNLMVEREFKAWAKAIGLNRKLRCLAQAKVRDGEAIAVMRNNPGVNHPIKLDVVTYETEQCQTPDLWNQADGYIDGIKFDEFGNPVWYDILPEHPGASSVTSNSKPERVPAEFVLHWFRLERPGQQRGVPDLASTLNNGIAFRNMRASTLKAAATAARFGGVIETPLPPNTDSDPPDVYEAYETVEIPDGTLTQLPFGNKLSQLKPEHPSATYESFCKQNINEQFRPLGMPYNKAACDSSNYNFASGRLDQHTYYGELDVDRDDVNELILNRVFSLWFSYAVGTFGWLGGSIATVNMSGISFDWDWPAHPVADQKAQAFANEKNLANGSTTLPLLYAEAGYDFTDEMQTQISLLVEVFGLTEDEAKARLVDKYFPTKTDPAASAASDLQDSVDSLTAALEATR